MYLQQRRGIGLLVIRKVFKMKRIFSLLFTTILTLSLCMSVFSAQADSITIKADYNGKCAPGDIIEVPIKISGNPGIWGLDFDILFDTQGLQIYTIANGDMFTENSGWPFVPITTDYIDRLNAEGRYHFGGHADGAFEDIKKDGTLCIIFFKINENLEKGVSFDITMQMGTGDIVDCAEKTYIPNFENCTIKVGEVTEEKTVVPTLAPSKVIAVTEVVDYSGTPIEQPVTKEDGKVVTKVVTNVYETGSPRDVVSSKSEAGVFDNTSSELGNIGNVALGASDSKESGINVLFIVIIVVAVVAVLGFVVLLFVAKNKKGAKPSKPAKKDDNDNNKIVL